jgi:hypothetical protein
MERKEIMFDFVCDMVQQAYHEAKLNAICGQKQSYDESLVKEHLEGLKAWVEKTDEEDDSK